MMTDIYMPDPPGQLINSQFLPSPRRVRAMFNGQAVADGKEMMLLRERGHLPPYYFPRRDVRMEFLSASGHTTHSAGKGEGVFWHLEVEGRRAENAAITFRNPPEHGPDLAGHIAFEWGLMDAWFEEDDEIYVHARDPFKRVDVLNSSRHVKVEVDGILVAETRRPRLLFETGLPVRYYIPKEDVRIDLLEKSEKRTGCPYKGEARYYSLRIGERLHRDLLWSYHYPLSACGLIEGLLCFFNEKVNLYDDGKLLEPVRTPWS